MNEIMIIGRTLALCSGLTILTIITLVMFGTCIQVHTANPNKGSGWFIATVLVGLNTVGLAILSAVAIIKMAWEF